MSDLPERFAIPRSSTRATTLYPPSAPNMDLKKSAELIRARLIAAAEAAYEDAGIQGLCAEGRLEAAMSAMKKLDPQHFFARAVILPERMVAQASERWAMYRIVCPIVDAACRESGLEAYFEYPQPRAPNSSIKVDIAVLEDDRPIWYIEAKKFARAIHRDMVTPYLHDDVMGVVSNGRYWIFVVGDATWEVGPILDPAGTPQPDKIDQIVRTLLARSPTQALNTRGSSEAPVGLVKGVGAQPVQHRGAPGGSRVFAEKTPYYELAPALEHALEVSKPNSVTAYFLQRLLSAEVHMAGGFLEVSENRLIWWRAKSDRLIRIDLKSSQLSILVADEIIDWIGANKISARLKIHDKNTRFMQAFAASDTESESLIPAFQYPLAAA